MSDTIKVVRRITILGHPCRECEWVNPPIVFEGVVESNGTVTWPIFGRYRIAYCPHCGMNLPTRYPK